MAIITWLSFCGGVGEILLIFMVEKIKKENKNIAIKTSQFSTLAAAEDMVKVTDTSLLFALSQWLDVETALPSGPSNGLFSGNAVKKKC